MLYIIQLYFLYLISNKIMASRIEWVNYWTNPQNSETGKTVWHNERWAKENADSLRNKFGYIVNTITRPEVVYELPDGRMSNEI